jgi:hypothetical protein
LEIFILVEYFQALIYKINLKLSSFTFFFQFLFDDSVNSVHLRVFLKNKSYGITIYLQYRQCLRNNITGTTPATTTTTTPAPANGASPAPPNGSGGFWSYHVC